MPPRYSIVIPTRSRAALLEGAIRNALRQDRDDVEVLVCDNASDDATPEVIASFDDPRLRSIRTPGPLLMHENWTFALEHARGDFVTYLCDDDAVHPQLLDIVDGCLGATGADLVTWRRGYYMIESGRADRFRLGAFTDSTLEIDPTALLDAAFDLRVVNSEFVPRMLNCMVDRRVLDRMHATGAPPFRPSSPDYSAMIALMTAAEHPVLLDAPLGVGGLTPQSIGTSATGRGEVGRRFIRELLAREPNLVVPPLLSTMTTWLAQTYMQCAAEYPALAGRSIDLARTYGRAESELRTWERQGLDVADLRAMHDEALDGPLALVREQVATFAEGACAAESDDFLRPADAAFSPLGLGAFYVPPGRADELTSDGIDGLACELGRSVAHRRLPTDELWNLAAQRCDGRQVVLYGLGQVGRTITRTPPAPGHALAGRVAVYDDGRDDVPDGFTRARSFEALRPEAAFVIITPDDPSGPRRRLAALGAREDADGITLVALARMLHEAGRPAADPVA